MSATVPFLYWSANYTLHLLVLWGLAHLVERRLTSFPARDFLWKSVLFTAPVTAWLAMRGDWSRSLSMPAELAVPGAMASSRAAETWLNGTAQVHSVVDEIVASWSFLDWLALSWAIIVVVRLSGVGLSLWRLHAMPRQQGHEDARLSALLQTMLQESGIRRRLRVLVVPNLDGPLALSGGIIAVPQQALRLSDERLRALLGHETAHHLRRDPEWLALCAVLTAVFFFNPALRAIRNRYRDNAEILCDHHAAHHVACPLDLAECLAEVAQWVRTPQGPLVAAMAATKAGLVHRVQAILEPRPRRFRLASTPLRLMVLLLPLTLGMLLPAFKNLDRNRGTRTSTQILTQDHIRFHITADAVIRGNGAAYTFKASGVFQFAPDDTEVLDLSPGAVLDLAETRDGITRRAEIRRRSGRPQVTWTVNGKTRLRSGEEGIHYQALLATFIREINVYDAHRAERILQQDGPQALQQEIDSTINPNVRETYQGVLNRF